ncbi:MAG TPA: ABC transporter substrate-binding protein [Kiritimatiellia bacterium]|nr:ABC transporter substrate-binding protein [Kiritimatiellia bacterium]
MTALKPHRLLAYGVLSLALCGCGESSFQNSPGAFRSSTTRIRGFDPVRAGDVASQLAMGKVYEGLLQYSYLDRPYRLEPLLAEEMPDVSPDGLVFTFRLKRGVHFHDDPCFPGGKGRELTAEDFIYSIKRAADKKNLSTGWWAFNGRIQGLNEFREAAAGESPTDYSVPVAGLTAPDPHTLQITLTRPFPQLLWILAMPYAYAVPREAVEYYGENFVSHPVGTGPFILSEWRRNYRLEYRRNPAWHGGAPGLERIVEYMIGDSSTRWLAFLTGQLDFYKDISHDNWDVIFRDGGRLAPELAARGIRASGIAGLDTYYIGFNMDDPVVGHNKKLRKALTCAFDSEAWIKYYNHRVTRARGPIPPGVEGYSDEPALHPYDLEKARKLLAEAGWPDGRDPQTGKRLELTLELGQTDTEIRESTELFIGFMDKLGVVINPSYNNKPAFFKKIEQREAQMFRLSWFADYPDAENFLQLFYGPNASPGPNRVNYRRPEYDRLYEEIRVMQEGPERKELYRRMAAMVEEDCPWIFMHHPMTYVLHHDRLRNYAPHDFPYGMEKHFRLEERP